MVRIDIRGPIIPNDYKDVYDYFQMESTAPIDIRKALEKASDIEPIDVYIDSGGGEIHSGSDIYTDLMNHQNVNIYVVGLAASAASVIAMAGHLEMSPTAMMMIHNVSTVTGGDYREMDKASRTLQAANKSMASAYVRKSGMSEAEALKMMDEETWITAQRAVELKLADGIMFEEEKQSLVAAYNSGMLSLKKIEETKAKINAKKEKTVMEQEKINLLKLRRL
ncbi:MAG: Clp protease ClpP [Sphaerochaetaceae bacterium]|nr:Clp protease ClpP [Sphaerochaetaceae bacterium]